jgi:hypothetical protein
VSHGTLADTAGSSGATVSGSGTGTLTIAGTAAQINAVLATATYTGNSNVYGTDIDTLSATTSSSRKFFGAAGGGA